MKTVHGTCVAIAGVGVLLRGPSGCGKSDLALRLIDEGAALVADDRVVVTRRGDTLHADAPHPLDGLIEVRGVGILPLPAVHDVPLALVVDLVDPATMPATMPTTMVERLPDPAMTPVTDDTDLPPLTLPRLALSAFEASTPAKLRLAARAVAEGRLWLSPPAPLPARATP